MKIKSSNNNTVVIDVRDFKLAHIFECGQCFRFNPVGENEYIGTALDRTLRISQRGSEVTFHSVSEREFYDVWYGYFDLDRDYSAIKRRLSRNDALLKATEYGEGIRILNQDLWETVVSFIISASNNIPRIKGIIERLCRAFGRPHTYEGNVYYSFPTASALARLNTDDLSPIRAGFRDKYIIDAARRFANGSLNRDYLTGLGVSDAKRELMTVYGIGSKVADCILLFGLHKTEAYPVDVWIKRVTEHFFFGGREVSRGEISKFAREAFGELGGYAQQYLFFYARENKIGLD